MLTSNCPHRHLRDPTPPAQYHPSAAVLDCKSGNGGRKIRVLYKR